MMFRFYEMDLYERFHRLVSINSFSCFKDIYMKIKMTLFPLFKLYIFDSFNNNRVYIE